MSLATAGSDSVGTEGSDAQKAGEGSERREKAGGAWRRSVPNSEIWPRNWVTTPSTAAEVMFKDTMKLGKSMFDS